MQKRTINTNLNGTLIQGYVAEAVSAQEYYPFGSIMPDRSESTGEYKYGFNGMEKDNEVKGDGNQYTTLHRIYDPRLGRWLSIDPEVEEFPSLTPYNNNENNPIFNTDPNGDCPWCITAAIGGLVGAAVEFGGQVASNVATGKDWNDIDYADVAIAAGEGAVIGLTGGLGAAGKIGKTAIKVVNTTTKVLSATGQGAVDAKQKKFGGTQTVLGDKSLGDAAIDAGVNLLGAAIGGKAPTGSKKLNGPIPNAKSPKEAVKNARVSGPVNRAKRIEIETKAKTNQKARNIANETIRSTPTGVPGAAIENVVSDKTKDVKNK